MDDITIKKIESAHPKIKEQLKKDYIDANNLLGSGVRLRFAYVYRTSEEQHRLFTQRPQVTKADSWQSIHNYGLAFDIVLLYDKDGDGKFEEVSWDIKKDGDKDGVADWMKIASFFKSRGYEWGGDWKSFKDLPHFQKSFNFSWQQLKQKMDKKETIEVEGIKYPKI